MTRKLLRTISATETGSWENQQLQNAYPVEFRILYLCPTLPLSMTAEVITEFCWTNAILGRIIDSGNGLGWSLLHGRIKIQKSEFCSASIPQPLQSREKERFVFIRCRPSTSNGLPQTLSDISIFYLIKTDLWQILLLPGNLFSSIRFSARSFRNHSVHRSVLLLETLSRSVSLTGVPHLLSFSPTSSETWLHKRTKESDVEICSFRCLVYGTSWLSLSFSCCSSSEVLESFSFNSFCRNRCWSILHDDGQQNFFVNMIFIHTLSNTRSRLGSGE